MYVICIVIVAAIFFRACSDYESWIMNHECFAGTAEAFPTGRRTLMVVRRVDRGLQCVRSNLAADAWIITVSDLCAGTHPLNFLVMDRVWIEFFDPLQEENSEVQQEQRCEEGGRDNRRCWEMGPEKASRKRCSRQRPGNPSVWISKPNYYIFI